MFSAAIEEYLELLFRLEIAGEPIRPASVARHLGVSTAAVTEMVNRLEDGKLISRDADRGVRLTDEGREVGQAQVRKHRLAERLLFEVLGRPWEKVHDEACRFEHVMSDELTDSMARALGDPTTCPHGNPIRAVSGDTAEVVGVAPLAVCRAGQTVFVDRVADEDGSLLEYLLRLGLVPGAEVHVEQVAPIGGALLVRVKEASWALGSDVAGKIWVREAPISEPARADDGRVGPRGRGTSLPDGVPEFMA